MLYGVEATSLSILRSEIDRKESEKVTPIKRRKSSVDIHIPSMILSPRLEGKLLHLLSAEPVPPPVSRCNSLQNIPDQFPVRKTRRSQSNVLNTSSSIRKVSEKYYSNIKRMDQSNKSYSSNVIDKSNNIESNDALIQLKNELEFITKVQHERNRREALRVDWELIGTMLDRLYFWIFLLAVSSSSSYILYKAYKAKDEFDQHDHSGSY